MMTGHFDAALRLLLPLAGTGSVETSPRPIPRFETVRKTPKGETVK